MTATLTSLSALPALSALLESDPNSKRARSRLSDFARSM
jgi:hypothetical protein